jgi:homoserine dehydrogenase
VSGRLPGIGLLGVGNIGRELFNYYRSAPDDARIIAIARRNARAQAPASIKKLIAPRAEDVISNPDVDVIVELTGDARAGARYLLDAIEQGKHVVTANKSALAGHWREIVAAAGRRNVALGFEATVGGGMPVVRAMQRHCAADSVEAFAGILNGTCNFILGRMKEYVVRHLHDPDIQKRSLPLEEALKEAQRLGYAEPDPTLDLNGSDTKYKIAILANLAFATHIDPDGIFCEGIWQREQRIMPSDFYFLHHPRYLDSKFELKLCGIAELRDGRPTLRVHPALIEKDGEYADLASVDGGYNGLVVRGARLGVQFYKGLGAGPRPTVVSIASDVREIAASVRRGEAGPEPPRLGPALRPGDTRRVESRGFIRSFSPDVKGVYAEKLDILATHRVNVQSVVNVKEFVYGGKRLMPDYIEIDPAPDGAVQAALEDFRRLSTVQDPMYFRLLEL